MTEGLLSHRITRQLVGLALSTSALGSLCLAAVSGALVLRFAVQEAAKEAQIAERSLSAGVTSFQPIYGLQRDLQNAVSSHALLAALVIDGSHRIIAASDTALIGGSIQSLAGQPDLQDVLPVLGSCQADSYGWRCLSVPSRTLFQGPLPWIGGSRLIRLTLAPLALQGMRASAQKALLIVVVDLEQPVSQALGLMVQVFLLGLLPLSITSTTLAILVRRALLPELLQLAQTDPLSGVLNRRSFMEAASHYLMNRSSDFPRCLALLDIDYFKHINDRYGHEAGDQVICFVSSFLQAFLRQTDMVARFGGDEFALMIFADPVNAFNLLDRICRSLSEAKIPASAGQSFSVTLSIGLVAVGSKDRWNLQDLFRAADAALYVAKDLGRNRVVDLDRAEQRWNVSSH